MNTKCLALCQWKQDKPTFILGQFLLVIGPFKVMVKKKGEPPYLLHVEGIKLFIAMG